MSNRLNLTRDQLAAFLPNHETIKAFEALFGVGAQFEPTYTEGSLLVGGALGVDEIPDVAAGNVLLSAGVGNTPAYGKVNLTSHVTGILPVSNGGTGLATVSTGYIPHGNGTSPLTTSANLIFSSGNLVVNGAPTGAAASDKLQINGNALLGALRVSGSTDMTIATISNGDDLTILGGASTTSANGGILTLTAGASSSGNGGAAIFGSGSGVLSGSVTLTVGAPTAGHAGSIQLSGANGVGTNKNGSSILSTTGNKTGAGADGTFIWTDNAASGTMTYAPVGDLLTVGNLKFGVYTAGVVVQAGYVTVTDAAGNTRRLLVG